MNLRQLAEADNAFLLEDDVTGFAVEIILTQPNGVAGTKALLTLAIAGFNDAIFAAGIQWDIGGILYSQTASATITDGSATVTVEAIATGTAGNQSNGTTAELVVFDENLTGATVASTVRLGVDTVPDTVHTVKGQYHRIGQEIDPETGLVVAGNRSAVTVRLSSLQNGALPADGWIIETTDITGATVKGKATSVMLDRTAGRATMIMRK